MKKIKGFITMVFIALLAMPFMLLAQDSTHVVAGLDSSLIDGITGFVVGKYPVIASIGTVLFLVSEVLGGIPSVKANSVYQLVFGVLKDLFGKKTV
jgi:putative cell wall-binding protein